MTTDGNAPPHTTPEVTMIRSEERLDVTTVRTPTERIRIRKIIVTHESTITVTLRREDIVIEREPLPDVTPEEAETLDTTPAEPFTIVLRGEEPVISTRVIPLERVHVLIDTITQMQPITGQVRKERIELRTTIPHLLDHNQE